MNVTELSGVSNQGLSLTGFRVCPDAPDYAVNEAGVVIKVVGGRKLAPTPDKDGYLRVRLYGQSKTKYARIHRLVATAFLPNPEDKPHVNHKDGVKDNNHLQNLEWVTQKENFAHAKAVLRVGMHKFTVDSILMNKLQYMIDTMEEIKLMNDCTQNMKDRINRSLRRIRDH